MVATLYVVVNMITLQSRKGMQRFPEKDLMIFAVILYRTNLLYYLDITLRILKSMHNPSFIPSTHTDPSICLRQYGCQYLSIISQLIFSSESKMIIIL